MYSSNFHQWRTIAKEAFGVTSTVFKVYCVIQVNKDYVFNFTRVLGPSMLPTFDLTGNVIMVSTRPINLGPGDIVLLRSPENPRKLITKRLIGLEGDTITFNADPANSDKLQSAIVPKGYAWVQGDNIYNSRDSRHFGAVPVALLQGRAVWKVWPPKAFGPLSVPS